MAVELLATAEELRLWLDLEANDTDELPTERAELVLEGVSRAVLSYCRRLRFLTGTDTVRVSGRGSVLLLPGWPVTAVTAVVDDPDGDDPTDIVDDIEWDESGVVSFALGGAFTRRARGYEVTFTHGYPEVPEDVRNVVLRVAARAISNPEGLATEGTGGYNAGFAFDETRLPTLSAPDRRELDEYRL